MQYKVLVFNIVLGLVLLPGVSNCHFLLAGIPFDKQAQIIQKIKVSYIKL